MEIAKDNLTFLPNYYLSNFQEQFYLQNFIEL